MLTELIARLEKATVPHRELDALIECELRRFQAYAVGLNDEQRAHWSPVGSKGEVICGQGLTRYHAPTYTFSIDAAASLTGGVPYLLGCTGQWAEHHPRAGQSIFEAVIPEDTAAYEETFICDMEEIGHHGQGATPAIALCIAALKARDPINKQEPQS